MARQETLEPPCLSKEIKTEPSENVVEQMKVEAKTMTCLLHQDRVGTFNLEVGRPDSFFHGDTTRIERSGSSLYLTKSPQKQMLSKHHAFPYPFLRATSNFIDAFNCIKTIRQSTNSSQRDKFSSKPLTAFWDIA